MPNFIFTGNSVGTGIRANMGADNSAFTVARDGHVIASQNSTNVVFGTGTGQTVSNAAMM